MRPEQLPPEDRPEPSRRGVLLLGSAALASATGLASAGSATARTRPSGGRSSPTQWVLPTPTGPYRIGTVSLHLIDRSRPDPWVPARPEREFMIQLWYPARSIGAGARAPWMPTRSAEYFLQACGVQAGAACLPITHGHLNAPVLGASTRWPVVLYSAGRGAPRASSTALIEDLASHGYVVVTVDHTYEAVVTEFPGGRLAVAADLVDPDEAVDVRRADIRFAIDQLATLSHGHNPDADRRPLPPGLTNALAMSRLGMFGHSMGGATTATTMQVDLRIRAGLNMDGGLRRIATNTPLARPFLLLGTTDHNRDTDATWAALWRLLTRWRLELQLTGAGHYAFTDLQVMFGQYPLGLPGIPAEEIGRDLGAIDGQRSVAVQRAYLRAFFDQHLRRRPGRLLHGPSPRYPEIRFRP